MTQRIIAPCQMHSINIPSSRLSELTFFGAWQRDAAQSDRTQNRRLSHDRIPATAV